MIFFIMGKSATGKDSIFKKLLEDKELKLKPVVLYTTRPMRPGEKEGLEYHFVDDETVSTYEEKDIVIEKRVYNTVYGPWSYMTVYDETLSDCDGVSNYIVIGTLESYEKYVEFFGKECVIPIYIEADSDIRKQRAMNRIGLREKSQEDEIDRRFSADDKDFSEENLRIAGIVERFDNSGEFSECYEAVKNKILVTGNY